MLFSFLKAIDSLSRTFLGGRVRKRRKRRERRIYISETVCDDLFLFTRCVVFSRTRPDTNGSLTYVTLPHTFTLRIPQLPATVRALPFTNGSAPAVNYLLTRVGNCSFTVGSKISLSLSTLSSILPPPIDALWPLTAPNLLQSKQSQSWQP